MQIPFTLLMTRLPVQYFLPTADLFWGVFTLVQYKATSVHMLYAFRFLIGALGGFFFPAVQWYLGSWYKRSELSRRAALFFVASQVGAMTSGYIQAGSYQSLNGRHGLEGWRWLYIICFACTIPIAMIGFVFLPGTPDSPSTRFLTQDEVDLARARLAADRKQPRRPFTLPLLRRVLTGWHFWLLVIFAFFFSQADGISSNSGLALWLKARGNTVQSINTITTVSPAVTIVSSLAFGILDDAYGLRTFLITLTGAMNAFAGIVLAVWNIPDGLKFFSFFLAGTADAIAAIIYSWANEICAGDAEERAITIAAMNTIGNTFGAWIPLFVWKTTDAPRYLIGNCWTVALDTAMVLSMFVLRHYWRREQRERNL
jgi:MFS family permease